VENIKIYTPEKSMEILEIQARNLEELMRYENYDDWIPERNNYLKIYQELGFSTIPIKEDKTPFIRWMEFQERMPDIEEIYYWYLLYPDSNIGIITGTVSNLIVFDYDYKVNFSELPSFFKNTTITETWRGYHFWFISSQNIQFKKLSDGVEIKGNGAYIVAPPSKIITQDGTAYEYVFLNGLDSLKILPDHYIKQFLRLKKVDTKTKTINWTFESSGMRCAKQIIDKELEKGDRELSLFILRNILLKKNTPEYTENIIKKKNSITKYPLSEQELKNIFHKKYDQLGCAYIRANLPYIDCTGCKYLKREAKGLRDWKYFSQNKEFSTDTRVIFALIRKGYLENSSIINAINKTQLAEELGLTRKTVIEAIKKIKRNLQLMNSINSNFPL
jgi:hypothetical protein